MELRVLDEVVAHPWGGVVLLSLDEAGGDLPAGGAVLRDALGKEHAVEAVTEQEGLYTLHLPQGEPAYFERLFRNIRVDATLFTVKADAPC